jgi:hypothetical protein
MFKIYFIKENARHFIPSTLSVSCTDFEIIKQNKLLLSSHNSINVGLILIQIYIQDSCSNLPKISPASLWSGFNGPAVVDKFCS